MSSPENKKRSFDTFESNQNNVTYSANKKLKPNEKPTFGPIYPQENTNNYKKHTKSKKNQHFNFFDIKFTQPNDFNHKTSHCLEFRKLPSVIQDHHLYYIINTELTNWYSTKSENKKNTNTVDTNGQFDIHLFHNRHNKSMHGFGYIYFENKSDASYILQLSKQNKLRSKYKKLTCHWRESLKDRDSYSAIYQTDEKLKGITKIIKISNLHWKTTVFHLKSIFNALDDQKTDYDPHWMKIIEDKNGYPKNQALIMLKDAETASAAIEKLENYILLGRKLIFEYSSYEYNGPLFMKYNDKNNVLSGQTKKLLLTNIKQCVKVSNIKKWLEEYVDMNMIKDIYLLHNLNRVCGGKCFIEFDNNENAEKCMKLLEFKQLCDRTVIIEYGHDKIRKDMGNERLRDKTDRLFISNLVWDIKEKDIKRFFGGKIGIKDVYFNVTPNGYPTGSGFITFDGFDVASKAFNQGNGKKLRGRVVTLDFDKMKKYDDDDNGYDNKDNGNSNPWL